MVILVLKLIAVSLCFCWAVMIFLMLSIKRDKDQDAMNEEIELHARHFNKVNLKLLVFIVVVAKLLCFPSGECCIVSRDLLVCPDQDVISAPQIPAPSAIHPSDIYAVDPKSTGYEDENKFRFSYPGIWYPTFDHVGIVEGKI